MMNETIDYCEFEFDNKTISIFFHCLFTRLFWVLIDLNNIMQNNHHMSIMFCDKYANKQTKKKKEKILSTYMDFVDQLLMNSVHCC